ncbi:MAG: DUF2269 family protein [Acidimicrobiaceae bacterium]|nr:DUF2269 family protein [Acidimicrobiaceae bacterium]
MPQPIRKFTLALHLGSSVGWIGAAFAYLAVVAVLMSSRDLTMRRDTIGLMNSIDWFVMMPMAYTALLTGVVIALATPWGLFRHWWVLLSLLLTVGAVLILTEYSLGIRSLAAAIAAGPTLDQQELAKLNRAGSGDLVHNVFGLGVLLAITVLNVYKPRGLTRYGWNKQRDLRRKAMQQRSRTAAESRA